MKTEGTYINFVWREKKAKTEVWEVLAKDNEDFLGTIKWFPAWRKYSFFPWVGTVYETKCLQEISEFLKEIMVEHKKWKKYMEEPCQKK